MALEPVRSAPAPSLETFVQRLDNLSQLAAVNLSGNPLGGTLPPLPFGALREVRVANMQLEGPSVPDALRLCANSCAATLQTVELSGNLLGGALKDLPALTALRELGLASVGLSGPPLNEMVQVLGQVVPNLTSLDLSENDVGGSMSAAFAAFEHLTSLGLAGMRLTGALPKASALPPKLEVLNLGPDGNREEKAGYAYNRLSGFDDSLGWGALPLTSLDLRACGLGEGLPASLPTSLRTLSLGGKSGGNAFNAAIPNEWGSLADLRELFLANSHIQGRVPASFTGLKNLQVLDVRWNPKLEGVKQDKKVLAEAIPHCALKFKQ